MPKLFLEIDERDWFGYKEYCFQKDRTEMVNLDKETCFTILRKMGFNVVEERYSVDAEKALMVVDAEFKNSDTSIKLHQERIEYRRIDSLEPITDIAELEHIAVRRNKYVDQELRYPG